MSLHLPSSAPRFLVSSMALALSAGHAQAQLQVLPQFVYSVSADGSRAVMGTVNLSGGSSVSLIDVASGTITDLGGTAGRAGRPLISADGTHVLATLTGSNGTNSAVYDIDKGGWSAVPIPAGSPNNSLSSWSISADGRYVGGTWTDGASFPGYVTDMQTGQTMLLSGGQGRIAGITPDGSKLFGQSGSGTNGSQWTRNADGSYTQSLLTQSAAPTTSLFALGAMSGNGLWAAGASFNGVTALPYRVDVTTGEILYYDKLPFGNAGTGRSVAGSSAISADGSIITGTHTPVGAALDAAYAYVWQAAAVDTPGDNKVDGSVMTLDSYLDGYGIDLENHYNFVSVMSMSADGRVISGVAKDNITGSPMGFLVTVPVPEPSSYAMFGAGLGLLGWIARRRASKAAQERQA